MTRQYDEAKVQSVTTMPPNARVEQDGRVKRYLIMMGIRVLCMLLLLVTSGWLRLACIVGAVVLPYIAVILANAVNPRRGEKVRDLDDPRRALPPAPPLP